VNYLAEIQPTEAVVVDGDRLVELCVRLGEVRAEEMVGLSVDNLWRGIDALLVAYRDRHLDEIVNIAQGLFRISENIGLGQFSRVCQDVEHCASRDDLPALSACVSRLCRIADQSINAVWDLCDIHG
jgi:hypothetical protein